MTKRRSKHTGRRTLSLLLALVMLIGILPQLTLTVLSKDGKDYNLTIDFDYGETYGVTTAADALRKMADDAMDDHDGQVGADYWQSNLNRFQWKHAKSWTVEDHDEGSIRKLLMSTDPDDTYIALSEDDTHSYDYKAYWQPIRITTNKVLDLNGHVLDIRYDANKRIDDDGQTPIQAFHRCVAFQIDQGATLTIIDSSAWRGEGTGAIKFTGYMVSPFSYDIDYYTTRDLFSVPNGNLIIYGGTFQAGRQKDQVESNFSMDKLKTAVGAAVGLGVSIAEYATGVEAASAQYEDILQGVLDSGVIDSLTETEDGSTIKKDGSDAPKESTKEAPESEEKGRHATIDEKKQKKNEDIEAGQKTGAKEGENKENDKKPAKNDQNTKVAEGKKKVVDASLDEEKIGTMVDDAFTLADSIIGMIGKNNSTRVTQSIKGTVVTVGTQGSFVAYGGTFTGYGDTPNTKNAVVEVVKGSKPMTWDHSKVEGGVAYIYGGTFEAKAGANVFNMVRTNNNQKVLTRMRDQNGQITTESKYLTEGETSGFEVLYYNDQGYGNSEPVNTANIQVRGGSFRCYYEPMNVAVREDDDGSGKQNHFRKYPGTPGSVNLGVESFNADLIQDGRIQIVDTYGDGALVLLDDRTDEKLAVEAEGGTFQDGLYHYRLFCGDNELRAKQYLDIYPNTSQINSSQSMQLTTYVDDNKKTSQIFKNDDSEENKNIRSPYRQTENYFDYMIDSPTAGNWSVMPNFHYQGNDQTNIPESMDSVRNDVYGEQLDASEVWYYATPRAANGKKIGDVAYGEAGMTYIGKGESGRQKVRQQDVSDKEWKTIVSKYAAPGSVQYYGEDHTGIRTSLTYFTYKVYRVDPLTRGNISESGTFGVDKPLLTVNYGASKDSLKCKLPLKDVEKRIIDKRGYGYQPGEMFRIVLEVQEFVGVGYQGGGVFGSLLPEAKSEATILIRCFTSEEQEDTESAYLAHDFTPVQWYSNPFTEEEYTIQAGRTARIDLINGKAGMTDFRGDVKVFDIYYQWWEVKEDGTPIRMLAGTDFVYDKANGMREDHRPESWNVNYLTRQGYTFVNTVNPKDPDAASYTWNGLPGNPDGTVSLSVWKDWKNSQLHLYGAGTVTKEELTQDKTDNLHLANNRIYAFNYDKCYIPEEMGGKYLAVKVIAQNEGWPMDFDEYQTFWSHTVKVAEAPLMPITCELETTYSGAKPYGTYDKPVTLSITNLEGLGAGETVTSVYYWVGRKDSEHTKEFTDLNVKDSENLPTASYPADFYPADKDLKKVNGYDREAFAVITTSKGRTYHTGINRFCYEVEATSVVRIGDEVQQFKRSEVCSDYKGHNILKQVKEMMEHSKLRFMPQPNNATVGWDFTKATSTNKGVAKLGQDGKLYFLGKTGEEKISVPSPDGKTVPLTVQVLDDFRSIQISGIKEPVPGQKLSFSAEVPDDAPYHIKEVKWFVPGVFTSTYLGANDQAEYYKTYCAEVIVEENEFCVFDSWHADYRLTADLSDGTSQIRSGTFSAYDNEAWKNDDGTYSFVFRFTPQSKYTSSTINEIYLDFPTKVTEGTNVSDWLDQATISTNGHDEDLSISLTPTYTDDAQYVLEAYNRGEAELSTEKLEINTFIPDVQSGIAAHIKITGPDRFASQNNLKIYINGEQAARITSLDSDEIWFSAANTVEVTEGTPAPTAPDYAVRNFRLIVGEPIRIDELLATDSLRYTIELGDVYLDSDVDWTEYLSYDAENRILTPIKAYQGQSCYLYFTVAYDDDGDGVCEYKTDVMKMVDQIYARASGAPELVEDPALTPYTYELYDPEGTLIDRGTHTGPVTGLTVPDGMLIANDVKEGGIRKITTVYADSLQAYASAEAVFAYLKNEDGEDVSELQISIDGQRFARTDHILGLTPNTEYLLYYRKGVSGQIYTKSVRTANLDHGVFVGRIPVTDTNLGNLERDGWCFDPETRTLILEDFVLRDRGTAAQSLQYYAYGYTDTAAIYSNADLTIRLIGDNDVVKIRSQGSEAAIWADGNLTIEGTGNLTISRSALGQTGLYSKDGDICLNGSGTLTLDRLATGLTAKKGSVLYRNGTVGFIPYETGNPGYTTKIGDFINKDCVARTSFANAVHSLTIKISGNDNTEQTVSASTLINTLKNASAYAYSVRIDPSHRDQKRVETEEYLKSGSCDRGSTYYLSCDCGHIGSETFTTGAGTHTLETHAAKPATCISQGWDEYVTCTKCEYSTFGDHSYQALGHDWVHHDAVQPTCEENGSPAYDECTRCGISSRLTISAASPNVMPRSMLDPETLKWRATGHELKQVHGTPAACTKAGTIDHYECVHCGTKYLDEAGASLAGDLKEPALGHSWGPGETVDGKLVHTCLLCGQKDVETDPQDNPFTDVAEGAYYYDPVLWAVNHTPQITNGTSATTFSPDKTCTRAQVVTFLWRAMGEPEPTQTANPFTDVRSDQYYYKAVLWAVEKNITNGTSATTFSPDKGCTRAQVVTFLWRAEGQPAHASSVNPFKDVPAGQYYYKPVLWAVEKNITKGTSADKFSPDSTCTRGQIVTFLYRDLN
ncbi:MAG: S-layer homology domain-containing protein [Oscillospiraceae bacterium]|nr:S-layer homology domain-containing protein [Oscillospiraceae bacterium]